MTKIRYFTIISIDDGKRVTSLSKVDWITWKTDSNEIINPENILENINNSFSDYNTYMNSVIYESIKYESLNGGLDESSINIVGQSPANEKAINILNNIDEIKYTFEELKLQVENMLAEQKNIEKDQLITAIKDKIEEVKLEQDSAEIVSRLQERLEVAESI